MKKQSPLAAIILPVLRSPIVPLLVFYVARSALQLSWWMAFALLILIQPALQFLVMQLGEKLEIGEPAPVEPFSTLKFVQGGPVLPKPGSVTVIEFWATWCPPCKTAIPHLNALWLKHKASGDVQFVGVTAEDEGKVASFIKEMGDSFTYPVALDAGREAHTAYPSQGIPHAYIIGKDGKISWAGHPMSGFDGALQRAIDAKAE